MKAEYMTGRKAAVATLSRCGIQAVFGIPGGHSLAFYDALAEAKSIRHILGRHEQGLGFMADRYARASGKIGVVTTTSGPAVAMLASARRPLLWVGTGAVVSEAGAEVREGSYNRFNGR